jgi:hypothetical protein
MSQAFAAAISIFARRAPPAQSLAKVDAIDEAASKLVDALADLSALRDREELEILMALGAAELLGASAAILCRPSRWPSAA